MTDTNTNTTVHVSVRDETLGEIMTNGDSISKKIKEVGGIIDRTQIREVTNAHGDKAQFVVGNVPTSNNGASLVCDGKAIKMPPLTLEDYTTVWGHGITFDIKVGDAPNLRTPRNAVDPKSVSAPIIAALANTGYSTYDLPAGDHTFRSPDPVTIACNVAKEADGHGK